MTKAVADKILVLGIDGMDPRLSKYHMEQGYMPNLKKLLEKGSAREDLVLLGGMPTITRLSYDPWHYGFLAAKP